MPNAYKVLLYGHILIGAASLVLFWIPVLSRKGSRLHRRVGRWYVNAMYAVSATAFAISVMVLIDPIGTKHPGALLDMSDAFRTATQERLFSMFLLAISILVFSSVRHGILTLRAKHNHALMRSPGHLFLNAILVTVGLVLIYLGAIANQTLYFVFAAICIGAGSGNLRYSLRRSVQRADWIVSHMGSMIGAGIGSYTAFFVFGGNRFLSQFLSGNWQLLPWTLPSVIGVGFTIYLGRKYRAQYAQ